MKLGGMMGCRGRRSAADQREGHLEELFGLHYQIRKVSKIVPKIFLEHSGPQQVTVAARHETHESLVNFYFLHGKNQEQKNTLRYFKLLTLFSFIFPA